MSRWKHKQAIMRDYNETAHLYDSRYAEEQEVKYKSAFEDLEIASHNVILDVGCGTGLLFRHVGPKAETVIGVDISRKLLLQAIRRAEKHENVHVVLADGDHLPFKPKVFSMVFAFTVLQNMPKPEDTLKELMRIGRLDSFFVVTGMKKVFSLISFGDLLDQAGLLVVSFRDAEDLKCFVAVCVQKLKT